MIDVILIGGGNLAHHLAHALLASDKIRLVQIYNRSLDSIRSFTKYTHITNDIKKIQKASIYIISVSDQAIASISEQLPKTDSLVVHTSGSMAIDMLYTHQNTGVFYPLQSFSKSRKIDFNIAPVCIEANSKENENLLIELAKSLNNKYYLIDSTQRNELHKAAVFVNNFVNHLYYLGHTICDKHNIDFEILKPLIKETADKIEKISPYDAQTGPARRGDYNTIENHLNNLTSINKEIYKLLSVSIASTYGKKL